MSIQPGMTFGRLTVVQTAPKNVYGAVWTCICSCGTFKDVPWRQLRSGDTRSCGCLRMEVLSQSPNAAKHGHASKGGSPTYKAWRGMLQRCYDFKHRSYPRYGGRGITVAIEWKSDFQSFLEDMGVKPEGYSLDRIDPERGYCKENCRWVPLGTQALNRRSNVLLSLDGETKTLSQWATSLGADPTTIQGRLERGWDLRRALTQRPANRGPKPGPRVRKTSPLEKFRVNYRHLYRSASDDLTFDQWQLVLEQFKGNCAYCGETAQTMDHVVPLSKGGAHTKENVVPACRSCNSSKKGRTVDEWILGS